MIVQAPRKLLLGLIGSHIQASLTPAMHEREARENGLHCLYQLVDLELNGLDAGMLPDLLVAAQRMGFAGLNITHPCKQAVIPLLDEISDDARAFGAVNTVVLRDGRRIGDNTDWLGFERSFRDGLPGAELNRVVQLGAGGAGAATAYAALKMGAGHITIFDIESERTAALASRLNGIFGDGKVQAVDDLGDTLSKADGLIHATPTGMTSHPGLPLPKELLRSELWVAEVVYFPMETELVRTARSLGCRTLDGGGMAVFQAVEAFRRFTGLEPNADRMRRHFASVLDQR